MLLGGLTLSSTCLPSGVFTVIGTTTGGTVESIGNFSKTPFLSQFHSPALVHPPALFQSKSSPSHHVACHLEQHKSEAQIKPLPSFSVGGRLVLSSVPVLMLLACLKREVVSVQRCSQTELQKPNLRRPTKKPPTLTGRLLHQKGPLGNTAKTLRTGGNRAASQTTKNTVVVA